MNIMYQLKKSHQHYSGKTIVLSDAVMDFLREYQQLCIKHGMVIISEGESVEVVGLDGENDPLWHIDSGTADDWAERTDVDRGRFVE